MINNFGLLASFKTSKPNAAISRPKETVSGFSAERSYSFKDSLKEAGSSIDREDNNSVRKELIGRSEAKLKKVDRNSQKVNEKTNSEVEPKEKQTEKISERIEEILAVLQQLSDLQQKPEVTPEDQKELVEGIKAAFHELTALQSKLDKLVGTKNLQLQTELPGLKQNIAELKTMLEGIMEKLKADSTVADSEASNFLQKLQTVIDDSLSKLEVIAKTTVENSTVHTEDAAMKAEKEADIRTPEVNGQEKYETKAPETGKEEAAETTEAANNTVKKTTQTEANGTEATEEEISALEGKTDKVTVQANGESKQENESSAGQENTKGTQYTANVKQNKTTVEGMQAVQQEQVLPVENAETVAAQTTAPKTQNVNRAEIINQIVKKAEVVLSDTHSEMRMQLEPENLGKLTLKIAVERGLITAKFTAESYEVKKVIESSFNELKDMLQEKGMEVQNFSVSVGQENKEYNNSNAFHQWKETVKLGSSAKNRGSYEGYIGSEVDAPRAENPYRIHNGEFDHIA